MGDAKSFERLLLIVFFSHTHFEGAIFLLLQSRQHTNYFDTVCFFPALSLAHLAIPAFRAIFIANDLTGRYDGACLFFILCDRRSAVGIWTLLFDMSSLRPVERLHISAPHSCLPAQR